jgi:hypothetical protein
MVQRCCGPFLTYLSITDVAHAAHYDAACRIVRRRQEGFQCTFAEPVVVVQEEQPFALGLASADVSGRR